jgi:hypothetical protein
MIAYHLTLSIASGKARKHARGAAFIPWRSVQSALKRIINAPLFSRKIFQEDERNWQAVADG